MNNLPLILFTLLVQSSIGVYVINAIWNFRKAGTKSISHTEFRADFLAFILAIAGMIASFTHLGHPLNFINSLRNIATSWMSRELLIFMIYIISLFALLIIKWRSLNSGLSILFRNLAFLSAVLLLFSMIKVYSLPGLPALYGSTVFMSFLCSTVFSGSSVLVLLNIRDHNYSGNQLFLAGIALSVSFIVLLSNLDIKTTNNSIIIISIIFYLISFLVLIPALIPKFKNIYASSAVIFIILGLLSEFINRLILLSFTSFSI